MNKELNIFIGISRIKKQIGFEVRKILSNYDLTESQFAVLEVLYSKGELTIGEVQDKVLTTSGNIPIVVKNLEKIGYILKSQDELDKRKFILSLTESGEKIIGELAPIVNDVIIKIVGRIDENEQENMLVLLKKISKK